MSPSHSNDHVLSIKPSVISLLLKKRTASELPANLERRDIRGSEVLPEHDELSELRKRAREKKLDIILHDVNSVSGGVNINTKLKVSTAANQNPA